MILILMMLVVLLLLLFDDNVVYDIIMCNVHVVGVCCVAGNVCIAVVQYGMIADVVVVWVLVMIPVAVILALFVVVMSL